MSLILSGTDGLSDVDGSASTPAIRGTDANTGIFFPAADTIAFTEGGAEAMRIDSSGNVSIGSTSSSSQAFRVSQTAFPSVPSGWYANAGDGNAEQYGITRVDSTNGRGIRFQTTLDGSNLPYYAISTGTAASTIAGMTWTERMRIDSSGRVGIGRTPDQQLQIAATTAVEFDMFVSTTRTLTLYADATQTIIANPTAVPMIFRTDDTERARITSGGVFCVGTTSAADSSSAATFYNASSANNVVVVQNAKNTSGDAVLKTFIGSNCDNTSSYHLQCAVSGVANRLFIYGNGNVVNSNNSYGTLSDIKLKQDIVDAGSQWDDIKNIRIRKFRFKSNPTMPLQIGVVAQELEEVSPGLIDESPDTKEVTKTREVEKTREVTPAVLDEDGNEIEPAVTETYTEEEEYTERVATGTVTKSVKSSILYMKAVKALQEAMARIETLEAQNAALEARLAALEAK